ncbi:uncharacterized protein LOC110422670 isoform X2 [Herrania umbratica]|uniref:Uncharacterized protein LOC110422670 isoform X2 n=1 Tax=Herrania umbratica TaxID=108875 RepID=A0A6J1AZN7_9ROSI|nr:uncharacterized protein LOC110422670 isoform X2 [Herrania umbratica]
MSLHDQYDTGKEKEKEEEEVDEEEEEEEELSVSENDDSFDEDMEALKQACLRTGADLNDLQIAASDNDRPSTSDAAVSSAALAYSGSEDDMEIFRSIRSRFALSVDVCEPLSIQPPCFLPPISSDDDAEDDFETLRIIQRRFRAYSSNDTRGISTEDHIEKTEPIYTTSMPLQDATSNDICERFQDYEKAGNISHFSSDNVEMQPVGLVQWDHSHANELSTLADNSSRFPKSAQQLIDAIKKNRSYQKFLRSKLTQIESKIEENKKLKERVKILKDFQVSCKKITGRSLSINKDPRIQLISARKSRTSKDPEVNDKNVSADYGPPENSSVTNYRMALTKFPLALQRKKWSRGERENLVKGIRQQFQESALQVSVDWFSGADGSSGDGSNLDDIIATVKDLEITPERIREFLPKVNWDQLASMYVKGRSGAECETRWLNHEDPLINCNPWTAEEDKNLLFIVQEKGISNWFDIAVSLRSNRTPFQCLARYQRSLNACILKGDWTEEEDDQLRIAVEVFGECDWQSVASTLKGRTGTQCSNRWIKSLHPTRQRVGRWTHDEDKRLKVAVMLFGPKNWRKIAEVIPGRTQVQCRERWVNSLDPALNLGRWTKEEDLRLEAAIEEHGCCWSKVAACMPSRTDNQCWRRWKTLHPKAVPLLQEARRIRKATLISNFVDRESERPALGPNDFYMPLLLTNSTAEPENTNLPSKGKRKERSESEKENDATLRQFSEQRTRKSCRKGAQACSSEVPGMMHENEAEAANGHDADRKKRRNPHSGNNNCIEPAQGVAYPKKRKRKPPSGSNNCTESVQDVVIQRKRRRKPPSGNNNCSDSVQDDAVQTEKRKQQSESNKCIEPMQDNSSSHSLSTLCVTTNNEAESFGHSLTIKREKHPKPSPKQCSKKRVHTEFGEEQSSVCSEDSEFSGATGGAEMMHNNGVEVDILGVDDASGKKSIAKPGSKRKTCMNLSTSQSSRIISAEDFENLPSSKKVEKRGNSSLRQHSRSRKSSELSGAKDDITLASFLQDKLKKSIPSFADGDEVKLAGFLRNKSKNRRHQISENAHLSIMKGAEQRDKTNQIQFGLQHCEAKTNCDGVIPENSMFRSSLKQTIMSSDMNIVGDGIVNDTVACHEVVREPERIDQDGNCEADGITLVQLRKRLKKRGPASSCMRRESELPSNG